MAQKKSSKWNLAKYKETIDFIYEATTKPGGFKGSFSRIDVLAQRVSGELVRRGVLRREGKNSEPVYTWAVVQHPTDAFYKSVKDAVSGRLKEQVMRVYNKKKALKKLAENVGAVDAPAVDPVPVPSESTVIDPSGRVRDFSRLTGKPEPSMQEVLESFSIVELWNEIKRRGCFIEDGKLAMTIHID